MRYIKTHVVNENSRSLKIAVLDSPGSGGSNRQYEIFCDGTRTLGQMADQAFTTRLTFQDGPIPEVGTNGLTHEALLAVVIDRLRGFQAGPFACRQNALALTKLEEALHWLHDRTREREARGVEGTHKA